MMAGQLLLLLLSHFSRVRLYASPQTAAHQARPSLGFSRQEHWSGVPLPSPGQDSNCSQLRDTGELFQVVTILKHQRWEKLNEVENVTDFRNQYPTETCWPTSDYES